MHKVPEFTCQMAGCCQVFDTLEDYEHHYHTLHRNVCSFCKRAFPSGHLLDVHILEWHDSLFQVLSERQDMVGEAVISGAWMGAVCLRVRALSSWVGQDQGTFPLQPPSLWMAGHCLCFSISAWWKAAQRSSRPAKTGRTTCPATSMAAMEVSTEAMGDDGDTMEVCSEHVTPPPEPVGEKRTYRHRVPSTICFGQGASRGFKSTKNRNKH
ncbi:zinc finger protein 511 isoform X2 [Myotis yumanensis]|uniref:zinc finger protein 511 isoform X2 n=1 Tax=Myotis yumanensis TaxID=159337 RepID=UPI0038D36215